LLIPEEEPEVLQQLIYNKCKTPLKLLLLLFFFRLKKKLFQRNSGSSNKKIYDKI